MRNLTISFLFILSTLAISAQTWRKAYDVNGESWGESVIKLSNNSILSSGKADSWDLWKITGLLINTDETGNVNYAKGYDESALNGAFNESVQLSNGKVVSVGYQVDSITNLKYRGWILTTTPAGVILQSDNVGDTLTNQAALYAISATNDGGYIVTGWYERISGDQDVYVAKYSQIGQFEWDLIVENTDGFDAGYDVIQTSTGDYVVTGEKSHFMGAGITKDLFQLFITSSGTLTRTIKAGESLTDDVGYASTVLDNGNIASVGTTTSYGSASQDLFVRVTDNTGNLIWCKIFSSSTDDFGYDIKNVNGEIVITGEAFDNLSQFNSFGHILTMDYNGTVTRSKGLYNGSRHYLKNTNTDGNYIISTGYGSGYSEMGVIVVLREDINNLTCDFFDTTYISTTQVGVDSIYTVNPATFNGATVSTNSPVAYDFTSYSITSCFVNANDPCTIANYPFTNGSFDDVSGNGLNGGGFMPLPSVDRNGDSAMALHFNGTDYNNVWGFPTTMTAYTYAGWFKMDSLAPKQGLVSMEGTQFFSTKSVIGTYIENGTFYAMHQNADESINILGGGSVDTNWTHFAVTCDQSVVAIYINGVFIGDLPITDIATLYGVLDMGGLYDYSLQGFESGLYGALDEVKVYSCSLSELEIDSIYQSEKPQPICAISLSSSIQNVSCNGGSDGIASVIVSGNQGSYSTLWSNGVNGDVISNLSPGTYSATVTDSLGCSETISAVVQDMAMTNFQLSSVNATCAQGNGSATIDVTTPINPPYSFEWSNGDMDNGTTNSTADSLWSGSWNVAIVDGLGCTFNQNIYVGENGGPTVTESVTHATCYGENSGSVNLTVSNANGVYTIEWVSGGTSSNLTELMAGSYTYIVEDESGCTTSGTVNITQPDQIIITDTILTLANCGIADGSIEVVSIGGTGSHSYAWDAATGNQSGSIASNIGAGTYQVTVSDASGCTATGIIDLNDANGPNVYVQSILAPQCNVSLGAINIAVIGGTAPYTYSWNTGATTKNVNSLNPGLYYILATDAGGCSGAKHIEVEGVRPQTQEICIVTVDTATGTNLIAWEKPLQANGIDHYIVYREGNAAGVYDSIGSVNYSDLSQFTDPIANPLIRAWRYKLSVVDSCGVESGLSPEHKTLHLTVNLGANNTMNLIWDDYVGFSYPSYYIARYHTSTGWINIDTIPSTLTSYTDLNPPSGGAELLYSVEAPAPGTCTSTKSQDHNSTRSNRSTLAGPAPDLGINNSFTIGLAVYPNPTNGKITLAIDNIIGEVNITVLDINGRILKQLSKYNQLIEIDLAQYESGIYFIKVASEHFVEELKIIKQ